MSDEHTAVMKRYDPRTDKTYAVQYLKHSEEAKKQAEKQLEMAVKTTREKILDPIQEKIDSKCPHCITDKKPKVRIDRVSQGGLFGGITEKHIYTCRDCGNEFTRKELSRARQGHIRSYAETEHRLREEGKLDDKQDTEFPWEDL